MHLPPPHTSTEHTYTSQGLLVITCICQCHRRRWREAFISLCQIAFYYLLVPRHVDKESQVLTGKEAHLSPVQPVMPCSSCLACSQCMYLLKLRTMQGALTAVTELCIPQCLFKASVYALACPCSARCRWMPQSQPEKALMTAACRAGEVQDIYQKGYGCSSVLLHPPVFKYFTNGHLSHLNAKRHFRGIPVPPDSSGLTSIAKFSLSTPEWNVYSKSHPNHQVASSLMLHWWKRFVWEFSLSTGSQNSTKGQLPSTSQYHSFSVKPANRKHSARANTRKAKEKAPSPWFGLLLGSLESETQNKKHRLKSPDRSKAEKMFSQILVKWNYPISQSFTCKQKWRALRTALRMNWKLYQVAPTGSPCCSAFIARSSVPFLLFPSLNCLDTSLQTIQRFRLKCILVTHALLSAGT